MSEQITAHFGYQASYWDDPAAAPVFTVSGDAADLALNRIGEAVFAAGLYPESHISWARIVWIERGSANAFESEQVFIEVPSSLTLGELSAALGDALETDPPTFLVGILGEGDQLFDILWLGFTELIGDVGPAGLAWPAWQYARKKTLELRYRAARDGVSRWDSTGTIPASLIDSVRSRAWWHLGTFQDSLGLSRARAAELLRAADFTEWKDWGMEDVWMRTTPAPEGDEF